MHYKEDHDSKMTFVVLSSIQGQQARGGEGGRGGKCCKGLAPFCKRSTGRAERKGRYEREPDISLMPSPLVRSDCSMLKSVVDSPLFLIYKYYPCKHYKES